MGHLRPILAIISTLLPLHPHLQITLFIPAQFSSLATTELERYRLPPSALERLRTPRYGEGKEDGEYLAEFGKIPGLMMEAIANVETNYPKILQVGLSLPWSLSNNAKTLL